MAGIDPTKSMLPKRNARLRVSDIRRIMRAMTAEGKTVSAVNIAADGTVQIVSSAGKEFGTPKDALESWLERRRCE